MTGTLLVERLLAAPGHEPARRDVALGIANGRIAAIGDAGARGRDGGIALPAMVNAHDHGYGVRPLALGGADDALECWIASLSRVTVEPRLEAAVAFGRMALAGIGAAVHCHNSLVADDLETEAAGVALAAAEVGIRVAFSCPIRDRNPWVYGDQRALLPHLPPADRAAIETTLTDGPPAHHLVEQVEAIATAHESELFQVQYGPIGPQWCRDATLERIAEASAANGRRVHMHLLESRRQREWLDATYRQGIVRFLDDIGLLSPRLTVAHGVHLTDAECALMAERGVTVAVNTACNLRLRSGVAPVGRFMRYGLAFGLGLDGCAHDDDQDYFRDLRLAWRLHNGTGLELALPPGRLFDAALRHGFRCIDGSDDYGTVEPGARADLVVLDYAAMTEDFLTPEQDEVDIVLARATSRHVRDLFVAGRRIVGDGVLVGLDLAEAEREFMDRARRGASLDAGQAARHRRRCEAVRAYYACGHHLHENADHLATLHEIVEQARRRLPEGVWNYLVGGAESETTLRRNRHALDSIAFRPRVLRDVSGVDCSATLLGRTLRAPVLLAPIGSLQDLHPRGGAAVAQAAAEAGVAMMLSSASAPGPEATARAGDGMKFFQLYVRGDPDWIDDHVRRAIDAGYDAFCFTVDLDYYARRERDIARRFVTTARRRVSGEDHQKRFTWDGVKRVRDRFDIPLVLKGIATAEDAAIACDMGIDVVYVSNHGGRQLDHGRGSIDVLPEVVEAVAGRAEILVDGGFLRGTDIVKAITLGATAVGIGRLNGFGVAAAGAAGITRVLELLEGEIRACLGLLGVNRFEELDASYLHRTEPVSAGGMRSAYPLLDEDPWANG